MPRCLALLAIAAVSTVLSTPASTREIRANVRAGQEARIFWAGVFSRHCQPGALPDVRITVPPQHGSARVRTHYGVYRPLAASCPGYKWPASIVVYRPVPGYRGPDYMQISVRSRGGGHGSWNYTGSMDGDHSFRIMVQ